MEEPLNRDLGSHERDIATRGGGGRYKSRGQRPSYRSNFEEKKMKRPDLSHFKESNDCVKSDNDPAVEIITSRLCDVSVTTSSNEKSSSNALKNRYNRKKKPEQARYLVKKGEDEKLSNNRFKRSNSNRNEVDSKQHSQAFPMNRSGEKRSLKNANNRVSGDDNDIFLTSGRNHNRSSFRYQASTAHDNGEVRVTKRKNDITEAFDDENTSNRHRGRSGNDEKSAQVIRSAEQLWRNTNNIYNSRYQRTRKLNRNQSSRSSAPRDNVGGSVVKHDASSAENEHLRPNQIADQVATRSLQDNSKQNITVVSSKDDNNVDEESSIMESQSRVDDWGQEIEEEEKRENLRRTELGTAKGGGIIHLPPNSTLYLPNEPQEKTAEPSTLSWRGKPKVLYDPNRPKISPPSFQNDFNMVRFRPNVATDPRLFLNMNVPPPNSRFRPPFQHTTSTTGPPPAMFTTPPPAHPRPLPPFQSVPDWYDTSNQLIYGSNGRYINNVQLVDLIARNDKHLRQLITTGGKHLLCKLWSSVVADCRQIILDSFKRLISVSLVFCSEFDVEFRIWKVAFYQLLEVLKCSPQEEMEDESIRLMCTTHIFELLDEGLTFYASTVDQLRDLYSIDMEICNDVLLPRPSDKLLRCALMSVQKCLLCLGDLARYKEVVNGTTNYHSARTYYQKACDIEPQDGRPFNQLAILAISTKRRFEAVYFCMRCLLSKTPFTSSHENLTVIFEETKRKWEVVHGHHLKNRSDQNTVSESYLRREIWIRPSGGRRMHRTTAATTATFSEDSSVINPADINKRFNVSFLYLIGRLYTHINMDVFPSALEIMRREFSSLVSCSPLPIDSTRLVQIMAQDMFVIEIIRIRNNSELSRLQMLKESTLQIAFEMFTILLQRCNVLLERYIAEQSAHEFPFKFDKSVFPLDSDLPILLSAIKIWCDWMMGNEQIWKPLLPSTVESIKTLASFATHLEKLKAPLAPILKTFITEQQFRTLSDIAKCEYDMVKLGEDVVLWGYVPWQRGVEWADYRRYALRSMPPSLGQEARRIEAINMCIDYIEGFNPPIMKWSPPYEAHIALVVITNTNKKRGIEDKLFNILESKEYVLDEDSGSSSEEDLEHHEMSEKIRSLKKRKDELQKIKRQEERQLQRALSDHVSITLEVSPRFIVIDTNCFIQFLPLIRQIASLTASGWYQLRVPVTVLNELAYRSSNATSGNAVVGEQARIALVYLRGPECPSTLRFVTSRGNTTNSLITSEQIQTDIKNDDLILQACIHLQHNLESQKQVETNSRQVCLKREVILITDDRNLRLKAHIANVPVDTMPHFVRWASGYS